MGRNNVAGQLVSIAAGAVASYFGGPIAGQAAFAATSMISSRLATYDPVEGSRRDNLEGLYSEYGSSIPEVFGYYRVPGNVIWCKELEERVSTERGGKGKQGAKVYKYFANFACLLCEEEIVGIRRIWGNNKLIYDARQTYKAKDGDEIVEIENQNIIDNAFQLEGNVYQYQKNLSLYKQRTTSSQLSSADFDVFYGTQNQEPSEWMEKFEGVGNVEAYRGRAYVVFKNLDLTRFGNTIPNLSFEIVKDDMSQSKSDLKFKNLITLSNREIHDIIPQGYRCSAIFVRHYTKVGNKVLMALDLRGEGKNEFNNWQNESISLAQIVAGGSGLKGYKVYNDFTNVPTYSKTAKKQTNNATVYMVYNIATQEKTIIGAVLNTTIMPFGFMETLQGFSTTVIVKTGEKSEKTIEINIPMNLTHITCRNALKDLTHYDHLGGYGTNQSEYKEITKTSVNNMESVEMILLDDGFYSHTYTVATSTLTPDDSNPALLVHHDVFESLTVKNPFNLSHLTSNKISGVIYSAFLNYSTYNIDGKTKLVVDEFSTVRSNLDKREVGGWVYNYSDNNADKRWEIDITDLVKQVNPFYKQGSPNVDAKIVLTDKYIASCYFSHLLQKTIFTRINYRTGEIVQKFTDDNIETEQVIYDGSSFHCITNKMSNGKNRIISYNIDVGDFLKNDVTVDFGTNNYREYIGWGKIDRLQVLYSYHNIQLGTDLIWFYLNTLTKSTISDGLTSYLSIILAKLLRKSNLKPEQYDLSEIRENDKPIRGYIINQTSSIKDSLNNLSTVYGFYILEKDGKLIFKYKSNDVKAWIFEDDQGVDFYSDHLDFSDALKRERFTQLEIPNKIVLNFIDEELEYSNNSLEVLTHELDGNITKNVGTTLSLDVHKAKDAIEKIALDYWSNKQTIEVFLGYKYNHLNIGDVVMIEEEGNFSPYLINKIETDRIVIKINASRTSLQDKAKEINYPQDWYINQINTKKEMKDLMGYGLFLNHNYSNNNNANTYTIAVDNDHTVNSDYGMTIDGENYITNKRVELVSFEPSMSYIKKLTPEEANRTIDWESYIKVYKPVSYPLEFKTVEDISQIYNNPLKNAIYVGGYLVRYLEAEEDSDGYITLKGLIRYVQGFNTFKDVDGFDDDVLFYLDDEFQGLVDVEVEDVKRVEMYGKWYEDFAITLKNSHIRKLYDLTDRNVVYSGGLLTIRDILSPFADKTMDVVYVVKYSDDENANPDEILEEYTTKSNTIMIGEKESIFLKYRINELESNYYKVK